MTLQHDRTLPELHPRFRAGRGSTPAPRLRLKPTALGTGYADGAWWPRTTNLTTELHVLISVLADRVGTTEQVRFDWNSMSVSQRGIDRPDGVRVSGPLPDQPPDIMYVFGTDGRRWELLVIAPMTDADGAFDTMQKAVGVDPR